MIRAKIIGILKLACDLIFDKGCQSFKCILKEFFILRRVRQHVECHKFNCREYATINRAIHYLSNESASTIASCDYCRPVVYLLSCFILREGFLSKAPAYFPQQR